MSLKDKLENNLEVIAEDTLSLDEIRTRIRNSFRVINETTACFNKNPITNLEKMEKHDFQLLIHTIPEYHAGENLSIFINEVDALLNHLTGRLTPDLEYILNSSIKSKIKGDAREYLANCDAGDWSAIRKALLQRFGESRSEDLLVSSLTQCIQLKNENYIQYHTKILKNYNALMQNISLNIQDQSYLQFKRNEYSKLLVKTFLRGILEPFRSYLGHFDLTTLEECLEKCRTYENTKQEWEYTEFLRKSQDNATKHTNVQPNPSFKTPNHFPNKFAQTYKFQPSFSQNPRPQQFSNPNQSQKFVKSYSSPPVNFNKTYQPIAFNKPFIKQEPVSSQSKILTPPYLRKPNPKEIFNVEQDQNNEESIYLNSDDPNSFYLQDEEETGNFEEPYNEETEPLNFMEPASSMNKI